MLATTMIYQPKNNDIAIEVTVYSIDHTHDADGNVVFTFCTAWNTKQKVWIVAPLTEFKPIDYKRLTEETT